jgi:hypothetical protein
MTLIISLMKISQLTHSYYWDAMEDTHKHTTLSSIPFLLTSGVFTK